MQEFQLAEALQRDCIEVGQLPLSLVLMMNDRQYPWFILVPKRVDIREVYQLTMADQQQLAHESSWFGQALMSYFRGDKLNIAALGNMVPQLHVHHIVRFRHDCAWPKPIWGHSPSIPYSRGEAEEQVAAVQQILSRYQGD